MFGNDPALGSYDLDGFSIARCGGTAGLEE
jgi:hypothetical protein